MKFPFDNTLSVKQCAERGIPEIPRGTQKRKYAIGDTVYGSGEGPVKKGYPLVITSVYEQHGYWYYVCNNGQTCREKDIMA